MLVAPQKAPFGWDYLASFYGCLQNFLEEQKFNKPQDRLN
jgi:hypothetical protein